MASQAKSSLTKWEIDRKSVTFVKKLSSGQLCEEWQGLLNKKTDVVIKTLKEGVITVADLLQEAQSLSSLCHPKIIALQAVSTLEEHSKWKLHVTPLGLKMLFPF